MVVLLFFCGVGVAGVVGGSDVVVVFPAAYTADAVILLLLTCMVALFKAMLGGIAKETCNWYSVCS